MHIDQVKSCRYFTDPFYFVGLKYPKHNDISLFSCKESATMSFTVGSEFIFRHNRTKNALFDAINRLEDSLGIEPKTEFVPVEGDHKLPIVQVISPFWFSRMIYFDLFCCIWKTLRTKSAAVLNSVNTYRDIPNSSYFRESERIRWAISEIHNLSELLQIKEYRDAAFLFNYGFSSVNGMVSAMRKACSQNAELRERINSFKNGLTKEAVKV